MFYPFRVNLKLKKPEHSVLAGHAIVTFLEDDNKDCVMKYSDLGKKIVFWIKRNRSGSISVFDISP